MYVRVKGLNVCQSKMDLICQSKMDLMYIMIKVT